VATVSHNRIRQSACGGRSRRWQTLRSTW
jgi:hypothetical protein